MKKKSKQQQRRSVAIQLKGVSKKYIVHHEKPTFAENVIKSGFRDEFIALDNIDLTIYRGEKVGIIGSNGAGKTTLLKIMAGITTPDKGVIKIKGRIVSLIDLEAGFHPDLTGEENIFLNGLVIGMSKAKIKKQFKKIVEFADIGKFIDAPLYTYSAGMKLRLGFSVAVHAEPEILLLDESMLAGDVDFRRISEKKIQKLALEGRTILMVSHWAEFLRRNCKRFIQIDKGKIQRDGDQKVLI